MESPLPSPIADTRDQRWMRLALASAAAAAAAGEVPVGAVLVRDEQLLAAAFDAIGTDRGEDEDTVGDRGPRTRERGAVLLRHNDAPLRVQLLLKGREEHPRPQAPSLRQPLNPRPTRCSTAELHLG